MNKRFEKLLVLAMAILAYLCFCGCKDWEYNVEKNGIHFEKIYQSKGGTNTGFMSESRTVQGFPCEKGWIHFRKNWQLLSFQLSRDYMYNGTLLPARTWLHLPYHEHQTGYVCAFPYDYVVQGYPCGGSGGYKGTHTGFYDNGKLRSFFPSEDVFVDGVPCAASVLVNVKLFPTGKLKSCKLAENFVFDGKTFKKGKTIHLARE